MIIVTFAMSLQAKANDTDEHKNLKFTQHIFFLDINFDPIKIHSGELGILAAAYSHSGEIGAAKCAAAKRARRNESGETSINRFAHNTF